MSAKDWVVVPTTGPQSLFSEAMASCTTCRCVCNGTKAGVVDWTRAHVEDLHHTVQVFSLYAQIGPDDVRQGGKAPT